MKLLTATGIFAVLGLFLAPVLLAHHEDGLHGANVERHGPGLDTDCRVFEFQHGIVGAGTLFSERITEVHTPDQSDNALFRCEFTLPVGFEPKNTYRTKFECIFFDNFGGGTATDPKARFIAIPTGKAILTCNVNGAD